MNNLHHNLARGKAGGHWKQVQKHTEALKYIENFLNKVAQQDFSVVAD